MYHRLHVHITVTQQGITICSKLRRLDWLLGPHGHGSLDTKRPFTGTDRMRATPQ